jgi:hypothetical protein
MSVVTFNPADFRQDFPQFADPKEYPDRRLQSAFNTATALLDNSESSPVPYDPDRGVTMRETMLYCLTCHLLTLAGWAANGQSGPISNASEGSVSVGFAVPQVADNNYYLQTPCGQTYWRMSLPYRIGGRYRPVKQYHPWG